MFQEIHWKRVELRCFNKAYKIKLKYDREGRIWRTPMYENCFQNYPRKNLQCLLGWRKNELRLFGIQSSAVRKTSKRQFHVWSRFHTSKCPTIFFPEIDNSRISDTFKGSSIIFINMNPPSKVDKSTKMNFEDRD